jgi:hypothetical protein
MPAIGQAGDSSALVHGIAAERFNARAHALSWEKYIWIVYDVAVDLLRRSQLP